MAFTVTATESGASASHGVALLVRVLTNATETGGASGGAASTGVTSQGSLTPNFSSSYIAFSISADNVTAMPAAATSNTYDLTTGNSSNVWSTAQGHYTGTVTAATPLTYGAGSAGASDHSNWCAYEIPASGGTITLDGSSPAGVLSGAGLASGTAATTASFNPPAGAVLVAEVCAGGTGAGAGVTVTMTDTSGRGIIWTRRAISSTSDNFQPTYVFTATVPFAYDGGSAAWGQPWPPAMAGQFGPGMPFAPAPPLSLDPAPSVTVNAGAAAAVASAPAPSFPLYIAGLAGGTAGSFVDQHGSPRLYFATVPWGMPANAGRWNSGNWQLDFDTYFADIAGQGMTAAEMHPWGHSHTGCNNDLGNTWDSVSPWTTIPTLNSTFWARIDYLLAAALRNGITVFLNLTMQCDLGDDAFAGTGVFNGTSAATMQTAAQNIATRYASQPNLIYMFGDDYNNNDDTRMSAVLTGLRAGGYSGPIAVEYYSSGTTSRRDLSGSPTGTQFPFGGANAGFNWCYYYMQAYFAVEQAYKENSQVPVVWGDGFYVGGGAGEPADTHIMRNMVWWSLASGARGVSMGSESIHPWPSGVFADITGNVWYNTEAQNVYTAFSGFGEWYNLIPDNSSLLVTAGRGTRGTYSTAFWQSSNIGTDNYVCASVTPDKSLAVIYCAVAMSITIDQTKIATGYTATWVDPANGATQSATTGTTYASSGLGNNSAGNPDWVLVLQGPPSVNAAAGVAAASASAPGAGHASTAPAAAPAGVAAAPDATVTIPVTLFNNFEGGTSGTAVTTGNAGGTGNTQFDAVNLTTVTFDNAHAAHGTLAAKMTAANSAAYVRWAAAMGTQSQVWFRLYLYFTALPSFSGTVWSVSSAGGLCAGLNVNTLGHLVATDSAGSATTTSTAVIPVNAWFRVEGFVAFSATVGQTEVKLFTTSVDGTTADETDTSAATQNTRGAATTYSFGAGFQGSPAVYWFDDVGLSATAYIGPVTGGAVTAAAGVAAASAVATDLPAGSPSTGVNAAPGTGLAAAPQPAAAVTITAGAPAAVAAAAPAGHVDTVTAGVPAAVAAAAPATVSTSSAVNAPAAPAGALAAAPAPATAATVTAGAAAATAAAATPVPAAAAVPPAAGGLAAAPGPVPAGTVTAAAAPALAAAPGATVSTSSAVNAPAAVAAALASAPGPLPAIAANGPAAGALAAGAAASPAATAAAAAAAALALDPGATVTVSSAGTANPAPAAALAAANQPVPVVTVPAAVAAALAVAPAAAGQASRAAPAGPATALAAATAATLAVTARAQAAQALAAAPAATAAAVQPFTVGTLTAADKPAAVLTGATAPGGTGGVLTASDTRTGGPGG